MAPTDGMASAPDKKRMGSPGLSLIFARLVIVMYLQSASTDAALIAKSKYYMDRQSDCNSIGVLDVPRDKRISVTAYGQPAMADALSCTLQFSPQQSEDTLHMWLEPNPSIGDCEVSLTLSMNNNNNNWEPLAKYVLRCVGNSRPPDMKEVDGKATIKFVRKNVASFSYNFIVGVEAVRSMDPAGPGDSSTNDTALIVGIVAAALVAIVLLLVLCVCCYRNKKHNTGFQVEGVVVQANSAFENGKMNANYAGGSPSSEKRLLTQNYDAEDQGAKPKSALDRFGPTPARRSDRPSNTKSNNERDEGGQDPRRSPVLNDLRNNPAFRKSLGQGDRDDRGNGSESSTSYNSNGVPLPPKLPPVPRSPQRSPSPQRKGEKIAGIFRARPSSSSSEIAKQLEGVDPRDLGDDSPNEFVPTPRKDDKADTRHVLRPNRGERRPTLAEERRRQKEEEESDDDERRGRNRERYRRDDERERKEKEAERDRRRREEERERQRRMEEEEEEQEEEERRQKKEREREKRRQEEEEEERERKKERKEKRRREKERDREDERLEGRFKKSASGRRSKGKGPRIGRSKSTSNALEEMEEQYQRSRSKSPSSVRSLNFIEDDDDDDDLDSSYMPFKRAGSKTSLYASRSSLYGRRRKNSMGETISLSSYAINDDADSRYGDFDRKGLSLSRRDKDKMFKSTGELEMHGATAQVVRECATQTNSSKSVYVYGRKTLAKSRPCKMYSRGCQTGRTRRDSTGSAKSGRSSRMRKSKSTESLRKRSRSRNLDESYDSSDDRLSHKSRSRRNLDDSYDSDNRSRRHRSRSRGLDYSDDDDGASRRGKSKKHHRSKSRGLEDDDDDYDNRSSRGKPRARPRKSTGAASVDLSESDDGRSVAASSVAPSLYGPPQPVNPYGAQYVPVMYPPPVGMPYQPVAPGGPPMMPSGLGPKPPIAPKPKKSKWDQLVEMTDKEKGHRDHRADSPTESMMTSVYSHPPANGAHQQNYYAPPSYTTAQRYPDSNSTMSTGYPDSSGMIMSGKGGGGRRYAPSESEI